MKKIEVILVDDHKLFREGLKLLLNKTETIQIVAEAENATNFLSKVLLYPNAIILLDIELPDISGIEAAKQALQENPNLKIIALSMYEDQVYYYKMIEAGAKGFLKKNSDIGEVINAVNTVNSGENFFSQELLYELVKNINSTKSLLSSECILSEREIEILELICRGYSNQEIADKIYLSKRTVDKHRSNILEKTDSRNTASLVMYAIKNKIIDL